MKRYITPATGLMAATGTYGIYLTATSWDPAKAGIMWAVWITAGVVIVRHEERKRRAVSK
ncbi:hypothetical protein [Rhodococcus sp. NPDC055024]